MKTAIYVLFAVSSSGTILKIDKNVEYEGKLSEAITEDAAYSLCKEMNVHLESFLDLSEKFYEVPLLQTNDRMVIWFKKGSRASAIKTLTYLPGCYEWKMRPCYGYYPNSFNHPCTFWIPKEFRDGKCLKDYLKGYAAKLQAQKPVSINGRTAAQLCRTISQARDKEKFSMAFIPLKLNLRSRNRCATWSYTPNGENPADGKWEVDELSDDECEEKQPDFDYEEVDNPNAAGARCFASLSGEYECLFDDVNMPAQVLINRKSSNNPNTPTEVLIDRKSSNNSNTPTEILIDLNSSNNSNTPTEVLVDRKSSNNSNTPTEILIDLNSSNNSNTPTEILIDLNSSNNPNIPTEVLIDRKSSNNSNTPTEIFIDLNSSNNSNTPAEVLVDRKSSNNSNTPTEILIDLNSYNNPNALTEVLIDRKSSRNPNTPTQIFIDLKSSNNLNTTTEVLIGLKSSNNPNTATEMLIDLKSSNSTNATSEVLIDLNSSNNPNIGVK